MIKILFSRAPSLAKPSLLFISPTMPALTGFGSAMRAGCLLEVLAAKFNIFLFVIPVYDGREVPCLMAEHCTEAAVLLGDASADCDKHLLREARHFVATRRVDAIHLFGLILAPVIDSCLTPEEREGPTCVLDLDDFESEASLRIARLYEERNDAANASRQRATAVMYAGLERDYLHLFDMVYVASDLARVQVADKYPRSHVVVVPNTIRMPAINVVPEHGGEAHLLFVGTMDYYPNHDAVMFFCEDILPLVRKGLPIPVHLTIVGSTPSSEILALATNNDDITVTGAVSDLQPYYGNTQVVVVPIRAGGGTRIKILEAFSHQLPVVSTSVGAEGLCVTNGKELLIGDTPALFAAHCLTLLGNQELCSVITKNAFHWVRTNHSIENVRSALTHAWSTLPCKGNLSVVASEAASLTRY